MNRKVTHGSSDSTSIGAVLYDNGPMKHALYISARLQQMESKRVNIPIPILLDGNGNLGLDDGIDTSDLISNLPGAFKQERVLD
jgi:hypothetical protein